MVVVSFSIILIKIIVLMHENCNLAISQNKFIPFIILIIMCSLSGVFSYHGNQKYILFFKILF